MQRKFFLLTIIFSLSFQLQAQTARTDEPFSFVGMRVHELFERLGVPSTVFAERGHEDWQDDVVFRYNEGDFFIFRDRVWQVRLSSAGGISIGDPKQAAILILGNTVIDHGNYILAPITGRSWPLMLRLNFNSMGNINAIYIYRPDY